MPSQTLSLADDVAAMAFVQSCTLLQGLTDENFAELIACGEVVDYASDEVIFGEGHNHDYLYMVLEGGVSACKKQGTALVEVAALDRQAVFGEVCVLSGQPCGTTAIARTDTRLIRLPGEVIRRLAEATPKLGRKLAGLMAARNKKLGRA